MTWRQGVGRFLGHPAFPWIATFALAIALVLSIGKAKEERIVSEKNRREADSLRATHAAYVKHQDSLAHLSRASVDTSILREESARGTVRRADQHGRDADAARVSVIRAPSLADSLARMTVAYEERSQEVNALRMAFDTLGSALLLARRAADLERERAETAEERASALQALNARILDDIAKAERGCRILGLVKCPSRKAAFALGVATGAAAGLGIVAATK